MAKETKPAEKVAKIAATPTPAPQVITSGSASVPIISLIFGVVSLVTFMWFLGVPAIVLGIIGIRKYKENRGFSITGLITGIMSTLLLIGSILFVLALVIIGLLHADGYSESSDSSSNSSDYRDNYDGPTRGYQEGV